MARPRCEFCDKKLPVRGGPGQPRRYCSQPCVQAAYRRRKAGIKHTQPVDDRVKPGGRLRLRERLGLK